ncbi:ABC transporter ATP-binding protein [Celerinatantimonas diazotrophica]|uniref:Multidrug resistance-like ATP-binding protein MdlA n=1 Tax=Celerinatantimonas diazotrophica TaxID=412034 RepID=A0A4R1JAD8_9GAMM|nr:ABC transporter transmembrane domain-containing protein [Celerinatantimonas diazotrophica]TCK47603.1 ATP-binding cassette subfamily B protein/ATP-binding cassette subfamily C protein/ATP-binding cassette subfamily B multidrug efflux pump [Celerinatantimonas diazotrophica]CAG9296774.1 putative multidrug resistance ABC transporter ATP-binding/permease protein YheI [Celerinatantimonas diazotrophica]
MQLFRHLNWFFRRYWYTYSLALVMLFSVGLINMAIPWMIGRAIDQLLATHQLSNTIHYLYLLALAGVIVYWLRFAWRRLLFGTSYKLGNILRERFYQRLTKQGQAFYSEHSTGDLMARATNDIDAIETAAGEGILSGFDGMLTFVLVMIMMFVFIDWRLAMLALLPFPFMGASFYRLSNLIHHQFKDTLDKFSKLNEQTQQSMVGIRMIKSMGREAIEKNDFDQIAENAALSNYKVEQSDAKFDPIIKLCLGAALLITLLAGGWQIHEGKLTIGQLTSFTLYLAELIWPMFAFGWLMNILQRGNAAMGRLHELLSIPDTIRDSGSECPDNYHIELVDLRFSYPDDEQLSLNHINLDIYENKVLAIAGPTGSGKSTLLKLLMRYWEAPKGQLLIAGQPITRYQLSALRSLFAYVPQDSFLFSTTIAENIRMGRPNASDEQIYEAARVAAIHDDILGFEKGYLTQVGERGVTLSGGQRQRLAIARALISDAPVLMLDDALSAVDVHTEKKIIQHLRKRENQTVIIVSHRLSALEHADEVIVLHHGQISERGSHLSLLNQDGWYAQMATYQQMEQAIGSSQHD